MSDGREQRKEQEQRRREEEQQNHRESYDRLERFPADPSHPERPDS